MRIVLPKIKTGKYVVAVSGGVDSVVLLDLLSNDKKLSITIAHLDHGIRTDSAKDALFVKNMAKSYGLPFVMHRARLGPETSEETAREARYHFLEVARKNQKALGIITAHHQDDELETAIINIARGTSVKGLAPMRNNRHIIRPLLDIPKKDLIAYAKAHKLIWREDSSNQNTKYLRNQIRQNRMLAVKGDKRDDLLKLVKQAAHQTAQINSLSEQIDARLWRKDRAKRSQFAQLSHKVACELMVWRLNQYRVGNIGQKMVEETVLFAKTAKPGAQKPISGELTLMVTDKELVFSRP